MEINAQRQKHEKHAAGCTGLRRQKPLLLGSMALLAVLLIGGLVWLTVSLIKPQTAHAVQSPAASASEPTPEPLALPDASDAPAVMPAATMPPLSIEEDWYRERCEKLYTYIKAFGSCENDAAIYDAIAAMAIDKNQKLVAFTFDDGPRSPYTDQILDVLEQYNARATFFVCGTSVGIGEATIKRALSLGCEIGNHTMAHEDLAKLDDAAMRESVGKLQALLKERFDYECHLLRPPYISYGEKNSEKRRAIMEMCKDYELAIVNHTRSSHDTYETYDAAMIVERMLIEKDELGKGKNKSIFLFHDKSAATVESVAQLVPAYIDDGYQLVTVSELLCCSDEGLHYGWVYSKAD